LPEREARDVAAGCRPVGSPIGYSAVLARVAAGEQAESIMSIMRTVSASRACGRSAA
jgi:hypothetical protein